MYAIIINKNGREVWQCNLDAVNGTTALKKAIRIYGYLRVVYALEIGSDEFKIWLDNNA